MHAPTHSAEARNYVCRARPAGGAACDIDRPSSPDATPTGQIHGAELLDHAAVD